MNRFEELLKEINDLYQCKRNDYGNDTGLGSFHEAVYSLLLVILFEEDSRERNYGHNLGTDNKSGLNKQILTK